MPSHSSLGGMIALTATIVVLLAACVDASLVYQTRIPNGALVTVNGVSWPGVGHIASNGGGARNSFGVDFAAASHTWTTALCQTDSDGDGKTNGFELGDPDCVWSIGATPARTTDITHPGLSEVASGANIPAAFNFVIIAVLSTLALFFGC